MRSATTSMIRPTSWPSTWGHARLDRVNHWNRKCEIAMCKHRDLISNCLRFSFDDSAKTRQKWFQLTQYERVADSSDHDRSITGQSGAFDFHCIFLRWNEPRTTYAHRPITGGFVPRRGRINHATDSTRWYGSAFSYKVWAATLCGVHRKVGFGGSTVNPS